MVTKNRIYTLVHISSTMDMYNVYRYKYIQNLLIRVKNTKFSRCLGIQNIVDEKSLN